MKSKAIIHIVDDEEAVRTSLATSLEVQGYATRMYGSGAEFLERVDPSVPGCALVDLKMPGLDGLALLQKMAESKIELPVVMMTGFGEVAVAVKAMKAGAADFLEKPLDGNQLLGVLDRLLSQSRDKAEIDARKEQAKALLDKLTDRERDVFDQLIIGKTNKSIGLDLNISPRTVEIHRAHIMTKLDASILSDLVRLAITLGIRQ